MSDPREKAAGRQRRRVRDEAAADRALAAAGEASRLPAGPGERLDGHLELLARHMREGVLAAAIGLDVLDELMETRRSTLLRLRRSATVIIVSPAKRGHPPTWDNQARGIFRTRVFRGK